MCVFTIIATTITTITCSTVYHYACIACSYTKFDGKLQVGAFVGCSNNSQVAGVVQSLKKSKVNIRNFVSLRNHKIDRKYVVVAPGLGNIIQQRRTKQWYKVIRRELGAVILGRIEVLVVDGEDPAHQKPTEKSSAKGGGYSTIVHTHMHTHTHTFTTCENKCFYNE